MPLKALRLGDREEIGLEDHFASQREFAEMSEKVFHLSKGCVW